MKKLLSLALCALMIFSAAATVFAAEENIYANDFEKLEVGAAAQSIDAYSIHTTPGSGAVEIVNFQGDKALYINHPANEKAYGNYVQLLYNNATGVAKWGVKHQFVIEYDLYIETPSEDMPINLATMSMAGATGTAWNGAFKIQGKDNGLFVNGGDKAVTNLKSKTWYHIAVTVDIDKKVSSLWIDGKSVSKDAPFTKEIASDLVRFIRVGYANSKATAGAMYLDNVKVYNATAPRAYTPAAPQTADIAVVLAAVSAVAASGVIVSKKRK